MSERARADLGCHGADVLGQVWLVVGRRGVVAGVGWGVGQLRHEIALDGLRGGGITDGHYQAIRIETTN